MRRSGRLAAWPAFGAARRRPIDFARLMIDYIGRARVCARDQHHRLHSRPNKSNSALSPTRWSSLARVRQARGVKRGRVRAQPTGSSRTRRFPLRARRKRRSTSFMPEGRARGAFVGASDIRATRRQKLGALVAVVLFQQTHSPAYFKVGECVWLRQYFCTGSASEHRLQGLASGWS